MPHRYVYCYFGDGAYVVFESHAGDGHWVEHTRWLVPGSTWDE
jgi:hypothetical protein